VRSLVFVLVLANLLFYAFSAGYFGRPDNPDAERLGQQVAPELMHLVSRGEAPAVKAAEPPAPVVETPAAPEPKPAPVPTVCLRWEKLAAADANRLSASIGKKFAAFTQAKRNVAGEANGWWVHTPPQASKEDADKKAEELKSLGVNDFFVVHDAGPNLLAISLGVFSTEKGAKDRLAEVKAKGVKSAVLSARPGKENMVSLEARGPAPDKPALLELAKASVPKAQAQDCK
jgi:hypothetical protein